MREAEIIMNWSRKTSRKWNFKMKGSRKVKQLWTIWRRTYEIIRGKWRSWRYHGKVQINTKRGDCSNYKRTVHTSKYTRIPDSRK